ncbi:tRNA (guanosine(46)-N7)-methyltransferase TrmB [Candidatus Laterigemmans baculatus]|uniref:tRNA (guanosine(46)-N7)-methyltransferase TrmB n=1 Tax=Candidatus Laterigemmans baculatus TaxID=2770505 RepID=UPI0013DA113F|nr:tRNA (guanosine(46)-N7)-methyltransferase TrmB [Candidatus Laterigemmans baculatus]
MPRRQVRRPDKTIDLSGILREPDALPEQLTAATLFGNERPLEIEVGSGKGLFLATASGERPEHNFWGIEIARPYALTAAARVARAGRDNVRVTPADAGPLFAKRIPDRSLAAVHVYFPDPWWKKKHKKRRVLNEAFLQNVSRTLAPGGQLHFWTDVLEYFETVLELAATVTPELGPPIPEEASEAEHDLDYRTHFERRSRQHAIPVYRVYWAPLFEPAAV